MHFDGNRKVFSSVQYYLAMHGMDLCWRTTLGMWGRGWGCGVGEASPADSPAAASWTHSPRQRGECSALHQPGPGSPADSITNRYTLTVINSPFMQTMKMCSYVLQQKYSFLGGKSLSLDLTVLKRVFCIIFYFPVLCYCLLASWTKKTLAPVYRPTLTVALTAAFIPVGESVHVTFL